VTMRILFVTPYVPSRVRVRPFELIRALARLECRVHLVMLRPPEDRWAPDTPLREACERVDEFPLSRAQTLVNAGLAFAGSSPLQKAYSRHPEARAHIRALAASGEYDVIHVEHLRGVTLVERVAGLPIVFDAVDSISHLFAQTAAHAARWTQRLTARMDLRRTERFEALAPHAFARTLVTSPVDRDAFVRLAGPGAASRIAVVPNGVDWNYFTAARAGVEPATLIFSGKMSYHANEAAARHLVTHVMPEVWRSQPDAKLIVAGRAPSKALRALGADPRVEVTGYVEDLRPLFARAAVAVSPLLYGAGIQNKVLEAMASGVPVVTSPRACASLAARPEHELLTGETAAAIARQVLRVCEDRDLAASLSAAGRAYVVREHDWTAIGRRLAALYEAVSEDGRRAAGGQASR